VVEQLLTGIKADSHPSYRMLKALVMSAAAYLTNVSNGCVSFQVAPGTGCAWMCDYCSAQLGPIYYFTDNTCKYQPGGCVGNPLPNVQYTCCTINYYSEQ
jgi:hypothetical protein